MRQTETFGDGQNPLFTIVQERDYWPDGCLKEPRVKRGTELLARYEFEYEASGNLAKIKRNGQTIALYGYDGAGRLMSQSSDVAGGSLGVTLERADDQSLGAVGRMRWTFFDDQSSQTLAEFDYTGFDGLGWYKDGSLRQAEETVGAETVQREFDYNPDGSLAYEERDGVPTAYQYQHGFLTQKGADVYSWNGNKLTAIDGPDKQWRFLYTANDERSAWYEFAGASGDVDGDGCVDDADLNLVLERYGQPCTGCPEDLNDDSVVDDLDLAIVLETFGLNAWQWQYDALGRVVSAQSCNGHYQCEYDPSSSD
ncbi:MAG: hypothetical protein HUU60_08685 [Armatimonadetes bacterium]|nr:hypothetical protein [Armatimonadota bacterium]